MYQPELKYCQVLMDEQNSLIHVKSTGYEYFDPLACQLLYTSCVQKCNLLKAQGATRPAFRVTSIIDGDTFEVSPEWKWNGETGTRVHPAGYDAPELHTTNGQKANEVLSKLFHGQQEELKSTYKVDRGRLVCKVFVGNRNLAKYFPEY